LTQILDVIVYADKMKTLDQVLTEKMTRLRLEQMGRSKLATLMIYLQDFIGLPLYDQEKMEEIILSFLLRKWRDRLIVAYLGLTPEELAEQ
jgi:hypothetical protein